jgi:hypothetical protein
VIGGWVLDADALTGFATGSSVYVQALVWTAVEESVVLAVPATVLAQSVVRVNERDQPALTVVGFVHRNGLGNKWQAPNTGHDRNQRWALAHPTGRTGPSRAAPPADRQPIEQTTDRVKRPLA